MDAGGLTKRLFLAVDVDDPTRDQVTRISDAVRETLGPRVKATWVQPNRMHLTLHFFGDADAGMEARLRDVLSAPIPLAPFDIVFDRLGSFPERGAPRVVWLGVAQGTGDLQTLHGLLSPSSRDSFKPHLTLARLRDRVPRTWRAEIAGIRAVAGPSRIDRVTLYQSRLSPAGPTYLRLAEAPLTCSAPSSP